MGPYSTVGLYRKRRKDIGEAVGRGELLIQFFKAKTICCGSDQSQVGAASQSWKTLGKVGFGWVRIHIFICGR